MVLAIVFLTLLITNSRAQWTPLGGGLGGDIGVLTEINSNLYAGGTAHLFRSTDNGDNWAGLMTQPAYAWSIAVSGSDLYCGLWSSYGMTAGVYRSTDNGINWNITSLSGKVVYDLAATDQQIVAIVNDYGISKIYSTTNSGMNWANITGDLTYGIYRLAVSGNRIYAGSQGLHVTTNNGAHWSPVFMTDNIDAVTTSGSIIFVGSTSHGVFRSTDYGQSWENTLITDKRIYSIYMYGSNVFAGGDTCFYVSTDGGSTFTDKMQGLGNATISGIVVHNNYLYVVNSNYLSTNIAGWKRYLPQLIGIKNISSEIPRDFNLYQNYPNPFNPSTKIKFSLPHPSEGGEQGVSLVIYDLLGRQVASLIAPLWGGQEGLQPGTYEVDWDAANYPSGVYFYTLSAGSYKQTKRMILLK